VHAPRARAGHARGFLSDSDYSPIDARILRRADEAGKADGTGFALFPVIGGTFAEGQYRLHLEFRRNNKASDQSSSVLRQAGRETDEVVVLDVPWLSR